MTEPTQRDLDSLAAARWVRSTMAMFIGGDGWRGVHAVNQHLVDIEGMTPDQQGYAHGIDYMVLIAEAVDHLVTAHGGDREAALAALTARHDREVLDIHFGD